MTHHLHVRRYGPAGPIRVLAIHGLTGHGKRWETLVTKYLPDVAVAAPDLLGHGRSSWAAPWSIDANVVALARVLDADATGPVVVAGHSFGGAIALHLAAARPDLVRALVLLDPAIGLDGAWMRQLADKTIASPAYTDREEARREKAYGSWSDVATEELDAELDEHLVSWPAGRVGWRMSLPAVTSYWSELARPITLPPHGIPTTLLRAARVQPPYVVPQLVAGLRERLGDHFELADVDCQHMVPLARPQQTADAIRRRMS